MLGLVQGQVMEMEPVLELVPFKLVSTTPNTRGEARLFLYHGNRIVDEGRAFYIMSKQGKVTINGRTGNYEMERGAKATFRVVFSGQHLELDVEA